MAQLFGAIRVCKLIYLTIDSVIVYSDSEKEAIVNSRIQLTSNWMQTVYLTIDSAIVYSDSEKKRSFKFSHAIN